MTVKQKARQLALTLVGEDQNPEPLIEVLMEMSRWQKQKDDELLAIAHMDGVQKGMKKRLKATL